MKAVILAGGLGTRISEETVNRPKPMVEIGGRPILWHILNIYAAAGIEEFIIALGYRQEVVKEYFSAFFAHNNDLTVDLANGEVRVVDARARERWRIHLIDTGLHTMTGGRIKRLKQYIGNERFCCTYGDGVASIDVGELVEFHVREGREATLTAVRPPARFGALAIDGTKITAFQEKPQTSEGWINGGFFVFEPSMLDRIPGDATLLEHEPLTSLADDGQLSCFKHDGFWQPMDTVRERQLLEDLWATGKPPWVVPPSSKPVR